MEQEVKGVMAVLLALAAAEPEAVAAVVLGVQEMVTTQVMEEMVAVVLAERALERVFPL